jgi:hypothetical protein
MQPPYVAQKLLVLDRRDPRDAAKDLVYVHDTLLVFAPALQVLSELWHETVEPPSRIVREVRKRCRVLLAGPTDDVRRAVQVLRHLGRPHAPDEQGMMNVFGIGLRALFDL